MPPILLDGFKQGSRQKTDDGEVVDLDQMVSQLVAIEWEGADPKQPNCRLPALRQN
jgi:hypothetical protein